MSEMVPMRMLAMITGRVRPIEALAELMTETSV
jgi:hypothetical protein